jgi:hypothetical protein
MSAAAALTSACGALPPIGETPVLAEGAPIIPATSAPGSA